MMVMFFQAVFFSVLKFSEALKSMHLISTGALACCSYFPFIRFILFSICSAPAPPQAMEALRSEMFTKILPNKQLHLKTYISNRVACYTRVYPVTHLSTFQKLAHLGREMCGINFVCLQSVYKKPMTPANDRPE